VIRPFGSDAGCAFDHGDVADPHARASVVAVARADVDVQLAQLGDLLALLVAQEWIGFLPTMPVTGPSRASITTRLADEDLRVPAADPANHR